MEGSEGESSRSIASLPLRVVDTLGRDQVNVHELYVRIHLISLLIITLYCRCKPKFSHVSNVHLKRVQPLAIS